MMAVSSLTAAEAERIETFSEVLQEFQRAKRATAEAFCAGRVESFNYEQEEDPLDCIPDECEADEEESSDLLAAAGDTATRLAGNRANAIGVIGSSSRGPERCFSCGRLGHVRVQCQQNLPAPTRQSPTSPCDVCRMPHMLRQCPRV